MSKGEGGDNTGEGELEKNGNKEKPLYKVGYKKPPKKHQFKKGVSGNPGGRPPKPRCPKAAKQKTAKDEVQELLNEEVTVRIGDETVKITNRKALFKRAMQVAQSGKPPSIRAFITLLKELNRFDSEESNSSADPNRIGLVVRVPCETTEEWVAQFGGDIDDYPSYSDDDEDDPP